MNNLYVKILAIIILISLNYSCDALCGDDDSSSSTRKEAVIYKKTDSLNVSTID